jgi:hypothetical protein
MSTRGRLEESSQSEDSAEGVTTKWNPAELSAALRRALGRSSTTEGGSGVVTETGEIACDAATRRGRRDYNSTSWRQLEGPSESEDYVWRFTTEEGSAGRSATSGTSSEWSSTSEDDTWDITNVGELARGTAISRRRLERSRKLRSPRKGYDQRKVAGRVRDATKVAKKIFDVRRQ